MTPQARFQAAIDILDMLAQGNAAEQVLTSWGRQNRFAGSKDRAAIRDIVFDVLRRRRSCAAWGGGETGRSLVLGHCRQADLNLDEIFCDARFAPPPLSTAERAAGAPPEPGSPEALDCPDWLWPRFQASLGDKAAPSLALMQKRAPVFLRVNAARLSRAAAQARLAEEGIATRPHAVSPTALEVLEGARRLRSASAYGDGSVELQDAASQAVADLVPVAPQSRFLDYCAGGGGKSLAVAARVPIHAVLHDVMPQRMKDAPARAERAGISVRCVSPQQLGKEAPFDTVLADAPCSGSGSWRRSPEAKWRLTEARLAELCDTQDRVLDSAARHVRPGGHLVYATCSLFTEENAARVAAFLSRTTGWQCLLERYFTPLDGADGFYCAVLQAVD